MEFLVLHKASALQHAKYLNNTYFGVQSVYIGPTLTYLEPQGFRGPHAKMG